MSRKSQETKPISDVSMEICGLIMAGGRSERTRATLGPIHKALVPVLGVPMLEWNICSFVSKGLRHISVALNSRETEIEQFVDSKGNAILRSVGGTIGCVKEEQPLGTIGAVGKLRNACKRVVVTKGYDLYSP